LKILFNQKEARNDDTTMKSAIFESVPQFWDFLSEIWST
jgi:hypothetical protein